MNDLDRYERIATAASFREAMKHVPEDGYVMTNRVFNINVYGKDKEWLGYIDLCNVEIHNSTSPDREPEAVWYEVGEEWK